jgi:hypothetical protein
MTKPDRPLFVKVVDENGALAQRRHPLQLGEHRIVAFVTDQDGRLLHSLEWEVEGTAKDIERLRAVGGSPIRIAARIALLGEEAAKVINDEIRAALRRITP